MYIYEKDNQFYRSVPSKSPWSEKRYQMIHIITNKTKAQVTLVMRKHHYKEYRLKETASKGIMSKDQDIRLLTLRLWYKSKKLRKIKKKNARVNSKKTILHAKNSNL
jgi:hypothetical protein